MKISLVTGSRRWPATDREPIHNALKGTELLFVGDGFWLKNGADAVALDWALANDCIVRVYCADQANFDLLNGAHGLYAEQASDWKRHGKRAGPIRNARMVKAAFDAQLQLNCKVTCFAFPLPGAQNRGTQDCIEQARDAGLRVIVYPETDPDA